MRMFIGISLDSTLRAYMDNRMQKIELALKNGKCTESENLHLTLKFIGDVADENIHLIIDALNESVKDTKAFDLKLSNVGEFKKRNKSILWIGVQESSKLINLYENIEDNMSKAGFKRDDRPYKPHITLGRGIRYKKDFEELNETIYIKKLKISITEIILYESKRVEGKLRYVPYKCFKLK